MKIKFRGPCEEVMKIASPKKITSKLLAVHNQSTVELPCKVMYMYLRYIV